MGWDGPGVEIHLSRWAGLEMNGPDRAEAKRLDPCDQQLVTSLYIKV